MIPAGSSGKQALRDSLRGTDPALLGARYIPAGVQLPRTQREGIPCQQSLEPSSGGRFITAWGPLMETVVFLKHVESRKTAQRNLFAGQEERDRQRTQWGEGRRARIGRLGLRDTQYHLWNRQLVGSCCTAQGAQLSALRWPGGVGCKAGGLWRERRYVHIWLIHCALQQTLTQRCEAAIFQK